MIQREEKNQDKGEEKWTDKEQRGGGDESQCRTGKVWSSSKGRADLEMKVKT